MRCLVLGSVIALLVSCCQVSGGAVVDFDNLSVASVGPTGFLWHEAQPDRMASFQGKVYFMTGTSTTAPYPTPDIWVYDPSNGLSNGMNHSQFQQTTDSYTVLKNMGDGLYISDTSGNVLRYDGTTVTPVPNTPFSASNYVTAMTEFNGKQYFGTETGSVYERDGNTIQQIYTPTVAAAAVDMTGWSKDGSLYVSFRNTPVYQMGYLAKLAKSSGGVWTSDTLISGVHSGGEALVATNDNLYTSVLDSVYGYESTLRRTTDGTTFSILAGPGPFKQTMGAFLGDDGTAYFFEHLYNHMGRILADDGTTLTTFDSTKWDIFQATQVNGTVYALAYDSAASNEPGEYLSDAHTVYLLTSAVPEPSTLVLLGIGAIGLLGYAWRRRKRTA